MNVQESPELDFSLLDIGSANERNSLIGGRENRGRGASAVADSTIIQDQAAKVYRRVRAGLQSVEEYLKVRVVGRYVSLTYNLAPSNRKAAAACGPFGGA